MDRGQKEDKVIDSIVGRLYSNDANDRVKAAAELGEVGTPDVAPELLKVAYEDEASTVRQMAIQAYAEILEDDSYDEIVKAAKDHFDDYVRLYAINVLGKLDKVNPSDVLANTLEQENERLQAITIKAMVHANTQDNSDLVFEKLQKSDNEMVIMNCLEALTLWRYEAARSYVEELRNEDMSMEIRTYLELYLASFGDNKAMEYLEKERIDEFIRIKYDDEFYRGREGLISLAKEL